EKCESHINFTKTNRHSHGSGNPDYTGCCKAIHIKTFLEDNAGAQEAYTAHDVGGNPGWVANAGKFVGKNRKKGGTKANHRNGLQSCRLVFHLPLEAQNQSCGYREQCFIYIKEFKMFRHQILFS